jgi:hypothetical protein
MINAALCKVLAHNVCCVISAIHELGIEPSFQERSVTAQLSQLGRPDPQG